MRSIIIDGISYELNEDVIALLMSTNKMILCDACGEHHASLDREELEKFIQENSNTVFLGENDEPI